MFERIKASPLSRTWLKSGLAYLLTENPERVRELKGMEARPTPSAPQPGRVIPPGRSAPPPPAAESNAAGRRVSPNPPPREEPRPKPAESRPDIAPDGKRVLPPEAWPAAWLALRKRRPLPPRPLVVWTYTGLGDDLMGQADLARQKVIAKLITSLRHPGGTHVFWPYALPGEAESDASLFWSGEALFRSRVLLLFGAESAAALGLDPNLPLYAQHSVAGRRVIVMPPAQNLADDNGLFDRAFPFLERLLHFCGRA